MEKSAEILGVPLSQCQLYLSKMNVDPPSVSSSLGFPSGYFVIRSLATGRVWDVTGTERSAKADGALVHLYWEKEASLVEGMSLHLFECIMDLDSTPY